MEGAGGAYGGGKAGGSFDPLSFMQRPQVILRAVCWVSEFIIIWIGSSVLLKIRYFTYKLVAKSIKYGGLLGGGCVRWYWFEFEMGHTKKI